MKKTISIFLIFTLVTTMFLLCCCEKPREESSSPVDFSAEEQEEIARLRENYVDPLGFPTASETLTYLGKAGDVHVFVNNKFVNLHFRTVTFAGVSFCFAPTVNHLVLCKENNYYDLETACEKGYVTQEEVKAVNLLHRERYPFVYEYADRVDALQAGGAANVALPTLPEEEYDEICRKIAEFYDTEYAFRFALIGRFDDLYAVFYTACPFVYLCALQTEVIDGAIFEFGSSQEIEIYRDGEIFRLKTAYEKGLLTREQLFALERNWNAYRFCRR